MISRRTLIATGGAALALPALADTHQEPAMPDAAPRLVMWGAALMVHPLGPRLEAVARSGFTHMSVFPADVATWRRGGMPDAEITRLIEASGVKVATIDPYTGWVPGWSLDGLDDITRAFIGVTEDEVFRMADVLGTEQINCVEAAGAAYDEAAYADALASFAERARAHGLAPTLEFMPTSKIADLRTGLALLDAADADVGLTFDTWHFWRSDPDHALLRTVPMERITEVQIADGGAVIVENLQTDLLYHRRIPGEGDFDLARTINVLRSLGPIRSIGPETFSAEMNALSADEAVRRNEAGLATVLGATDQTPG